MNVSFPNKKSLGLSITLSLMLSFFSCTSAQENDNFRDAAPQSNLPTIITPRPTEYVKKSNSIVDELILGEPLSIERGTTYFRWTPHWSLNGGITEHSRIDLVQGLPGYSLIAGKHTLVAFTPYPSGMRTDNDSVWLDVYKLHPWGASSKISHIRGTPVDINQTCEGVTPKCAEVNFFVDGEYVEEFGDYWFVVTWYKQDSSVQIIDSTVARFHEPAAIKVLFVAIGEDVFDDIHANSNSSAMNSIDNYLSKMPFPSDQIDKLGSDSPYADVYPGYVPFDDQWKLDGFYDVRAMLGAVAEKLKDYNEDALVKADYGVGLYFYQLHRITAVGYASGPFAVCDAFAHRGVCTHEIGHVLDPTDEHTDSGASLWTCGYGKEFDYLIDYQDWAYDTSTKYIYSRPGNVMHDRQVVGRYGFFTRHFYEAACIYYGGDCAAQEGSFRLKTLDTNRYLQGDSHTGQVNLVSAEGPEYPLWRVETSRREDTSTYVSLYVADICFGYCPFSMLICNPHTGEIMTTDPSYYSNNREQFSGWGHEWQIEQIAAGIVTLECNKSIWGHWYWFLKWEYSEAKLNLDEPASMNEEHWTPTFQWRIIKPRPYSGYPKY